MNSNQNQNTGASQRDILTAEAKKGSGSIMFFAILSVVNAFLVIFEANISFSFSAALPPFLAYLGNFERENGNTSVFIVFTIAALLVVGLFFVCAFASKKNPAWYVPAIVLTVVDVVFSFLIYDFMGIIISVLFHVWLIYDVAKSMKAVSKLKKLPLTYEAEYTAPAEEAAPQAEPEALPDEEQTNNDGEQN